MSPRRTGMGRGRTLRTLVVLAAVSACLGAVAYAATRPQRPATGLGGAQPLAVGARGPAGPAGRPWLLPRFIEVPEPVSAVSEPQFRFHVPPRAGRAGAAPGTPRAEGGETPKRRFQCRLDAEAWEACASPHRLVPTAVGSHLLAVRALDHAGRPGPSASYAWRRVAAAAPTEQADPKPFTIEARGGLDGLYPGDPAREVALLIANPNPVPIEVTRVTVALAPGSAGCPAENFELIPSSVSAATPLSVPANGSASLPSPTASAPAIAMLDLPVNQDACRGAAVPLVLGGEAEG